VFVQVTKSKRKDKTYLTYLVRESFRTPQGPRSRTVCNITRLPPQVRDLVSEALKGKTFLDAEHVQLENALDYGGLAVLVDAWERFGMDRLLEDIPSARKRGLIKAMIFSRLLFPCSKLDLSEQAGGTLLAQACGLEAHEDFDEDTLYAAMDAFSGRWVETEQALHRAAFGKQVSLVLYDLTSTYFEGDGPDKLAQYGHSRDHRSDRKQIILAVATDINGVPLHLSILRGNRADTSTLRGLLERLRRRFGICEATFSFDGGMSSRLNLEALEAEELSYVTRQSNATLMSVIKALPEERQLELGDRTRLLEVEHEGCRYVIAGGTWRQQRDRERREARLSKAETALAQLAGRSRKRVDAQKLASQAGRILQRMKAHKYYDYHVDETGQLQWSRRATVIAAEEQVDGWYLLRTNLCAQKTSAGEVLAHYKSLLNVEDAFRELKTYLEVRPVYHYRPDRVVNHVRLCFIAYWLSARLRQEWAALNCHREVPRVLQQLQAIRLGSFRVMEKEVPAAITKISPELNEILTQLHLLPLFAAPPKWAGNTKL
jgi:transposase